MDRESRKGIRFNTGRTHFKKGFTPWNKGIPISEETRAKVSAKLKGRIVWNKGLKVGKANSGTLAKGMIPWNKGGGEYSVETRLKMSLAHTGIPSKKKGRKFPNVSGPNNWKWIHDRTKAMEKRQVRNSFEWKQWRASVFARDNFTCKECGITGVYIESHHIIPVRSDESKLFEITNGITLCRPCHIKTMGKEAMFADRYSALLTIV